MVFVLNHSFSLKKYIHNIVFICLFFSLKLSAAYRAGNITYKWLYGYTYEIQFTTFTDNTGIDNYCTIDSVCYGDGTNGSLTRTNGPSAFCSPPAHDGVPIYPMVKMNEYKTIHTYPGPGNYRFCFQQPNRNPGIINMPNSANNIISFESTLVISTFSGPNSSPVFASIAYDHACLNNGCYIYNASGTDDDGDSLAYKLLPCNYGGIPGYSFPGAGTGNTFSIDSVTGLVSWCNPQFAGDYNVGIKIEEWRNDGSGNNSLIGYTIRDVQFTIDNCTGIDDRYIEKPDISVFPNPTTDHIEIQFNKPSSDLYSIELTDISGRTISFLLKDSAITSSMQFDLKGISTGVYFMKITGNNQTVVKKLIKQ